jgi:hypothetical protein
MGLSAGSGLSVGGNENADMTAIVNGGEPFLNRLKQYQDAVSQYNKAYADMNLGKSAVAANNEAARLLGATKEKCDALIAEANKTADDIKTRLASHEDNIKAATNNALNAAFTTKAEAEAKLAAADDAHKRALSIAADASAKVDALVAEAQKKAEAIKAEALVYATGTKAQATALMAAAQAKMTEATTLHAKATDKLAKIKSLAGD